MEVKQNKKLFTALAVYLILIVFLLVITNLTAFREWTSNVLRMFRSIIIGLVIAYLCNPIFRFYERKLFYGLRPHGLRRILSLTCAYLTIALIFAVLLMLIVPQLVGSIASFVENIDASLENAIDDANAILEFINGKMPSKPDGTPSIPYLTLESVRETVRAWVESIDIDGNTIWNLIGQYRDEIVKYTGEILQLLADIVLGFFISIYLLVTKEKRYAQVMRFRRAFLSEKVNAVITNICTTADKSFGGFLRGKVLDSSIVGVLVYCVISIMGVPYAILISVIVAITDIVPVIGPFIGVIPSALIILLTDPAKVLPFLICILVVQQIDGNIIAPKILGEHTGISSLAVIIAISTMGALWGFIGMVIGVPLFATVLELVSTWLDKKLKQKGLPTNVDIYQSVETVTTANSNALGRRRRKMQSQSRVNSGEGDLSAFEHFSLDTYALARKHHLFSRNSDELFSQFATEEAKVVEIAEEELAAEIIAQEEVAKIEEALEEALAAEEIGIEPAVEAVAKPATNEIVAESDNNEPETVPEDNETDAEDGTEEDSETQSDIAEETGNACPVLEPVADVAPEIDTETQPQA